ncbi:hypothetical protein PAMC26510_24935 [Caballeronia sordidicola]|uniref:Uncharacterized protein n=1 Tax=Caballeronia sordidicola TaxID=196367 RepID=A0A242MI96_CABSO|nr:hypothetical protein PAMC26510_24935 [Caballeronia sordidicola]
MWDYTGLYCRPVNVCHNWSCPQPFQNKQSYSGLAFDHVV